MMPPDKRKPPRRATSAAHENVLLGKLNGFKDTPDALAYQAFRLRERFPGLSWPVARSVAELAFSAGRAA